METKSNKNPTGFMPPRISLYSSPSSYAIKRIMRKTRLDLEKIWAEQERDQNSESQESDSSNNL